MYCPHCAKIIKENYEYCPGCGKSVKVQNAENALPVGTVLSNRYFVGAVLGQGGFGITYVGCDTRLNKKVAIKEYYPAGYVSRYSEHSTNLSVASGDAATTFEHEKQKFIKEAYLLAEFAGDRNIVNVTDILVEHNTAYIVMEYVEGETLDRLIRQNGKMSFTEAFTMLEPMMKSLSRVHSKGLIHRDISPANIMVLSDRQITLIDFGAAREFDSQAERSLSVILKHGYAPTEQYMTKGPQGPWTDVYAVCATIYKMITGITPPSAIDRMVGDIMKKPSEVGAAIMPAQEAALMKGLSVLQNERYSSMDELHDALLGKAPAQMEATEIITPVAAQATEIITPVTGSGAVEESNDDAAVEETVAVRQDAGPASDASEKAEVADETANNTIEVPEDTDVDAADASNKAVKDIEVKADFPPEATSLLTPGSKPKPAFSYAPTEMIQQENSQQITPPVEEKEKRAEEPAKEEKPLFRDIPPESDHRTAIIDHKTKKDPKKMVAIIAAGVGAAALIGVIANIVGNSEGGTATCVDDNYSVNTYTDTNYTDNTYTEEKTDTAGDSVDTAATTTTESEILVTESSQDDVAADTATEESDTVNLPSFYDSSSFTYEGDALKFEDDNFTSRLGIDVSYHQGNIDWNKVKAAGVDFAFIRIGYRGYSAEGSIKPDSLFTENIKNAQAAGIDVGVYFFSQAISAAEAEEEAEYVISALSGYTLQLPVAVEPITIMEGGRTEGTDGWQLARNANAFCDTITAAGYKTLVAFNDEQWNTYESMLKTVNYPFWYGNYEKGSMPPFSCEFFQYSNHGNVDGISTVVDMDIQFVAK